MGVVREGRSDYYSVIYLQATLILLLILFYKKNLSDEKYLMAFKKKSYIANEIDQKVESREPPKQDRNLRK